MSVVDQRQISESILNNTKNENKYLSDLSGMFSIITLNIRSNDNNSFY